MDNKELFARIIAGPRPHKIVEFPRKDMDGNTIELAICILTSAESTIVIADTEKEVRQMLKESLPNKEDAKKGYDDLYNTLCSRNLLFAACKNKDDLKQSFFPNKQVILQALTVDELAILQNHYQTTVIELGPVISELSDEDQEYWIKRLQEAGKSGSFLLNSFSSEALSALLMYMVDEYQKLQTSNSSSGLQQENTETN